MRGEDTEIYRKNFLYEHTIEIKLLLIQTRLLQTKICYNFHGNH